MKIHLDNNHIYTVGGRVKISVTQLLAENGLSDFSMIPEVRLQRAMDFGKAVHTVCEYHDTGVLDGAFIKRIKGWEHVEPYLAGWKKYLYDWDVELLEIEKKYYSPIWNFCGTLDRCLNEKGVKTITDLKTVAVLQKSVGLQLAGYDILWEEKHKREAKIKNRVAIQLKADGTYKRELYQDKSDINVFKSMVSVRNWKVNKGYIKQKEV